MTDRIVSRYDGDGERVVNVVQAGPVGPAGAGAANTYNEAETDAAIDAAVAAHAASTTPHTEALSGRDFAAWFTTGVI